MGALDGVRVVELPGRLAGPLTGWLLADQGADVVAIRPHKPGTRAEAALDRGKRVLAADGSDVATLVARADVVIGRVQAGDHTVVVKLPAFAHDDPLAGTPDLGEGLPAAATGLFDLPVGPPHFQPFCIPSLTAALVAATGAVAALMARRETGRGAVVEVPLGDASLFAQELAALLTVDAPRWPSLQWAATPFIHAYPCADGRWVYLHAGLPHHLERLVRALHDTGCDRASRALFKRCSEQTRADPSSVPSLAEAADLRRQLAALFAERPAQAWEDALAPAGVCIVLCRTAGEWRQHPHATRAGLVVAVDDPDLGQHAQPGPQVTVQGGGPAGPRRWSHVSEVLADWDPRQGASTAHGEAGPPLDGVTVLDLSQVIAGPVAARMLAALGADVVRVESPRLSAPWADAFHSLFGAGKDSVSIDLGDDTSRAALSTWIDEHGPRVVVDNFVPGVLDRLGLGGDTLGALPGLVHTTVSAWGHDGPWAGRPGWEQTVQAGCGMQLDYGGAVPELCPTPANDLCTGLSAAFGTVCALFADPEGARSATVHARLASTAFLLQLPHALEPAGRAPATARGGGPGDRPEHRLVSCRDGWGLLASTEALRTLWRVEGLEPLRTAEPGAEVDVLESLLVQDDIHTWAERMAASPLSGRVALVPRSRLAEALAARGGRARRVSIPGIGEVTEVALPLRITGVPLPDLHPAHRRGADTERHLGIAPAPLPEPASLSTAAWALSQAKWGAYIAAERLG